MFDYGNRDFRIENHELIPGITFILIFFQNHYGGMGGGHCKFFLFFLLMKQGI